VVMDHCLRHRAQCGDVQLPLPPIPGAAGEAAARPTAAPAQDAGA
jgi:chorismate synthase